MEMYENMENNILNIPNTYDAFGISNTITNIDGKEYETGSWKRQEICQIVTKNRSKNARVFKIVNRSKAKEKI